MRRSIVVAGLLLIVATVVVGILYQRTTTAQVEEGKLAYILDDEAGDDKVVARVDDVELLRGYLRRIAEFESVTNGTEPEVTLHRTIINHVDNIIQYAEAKKLGYVATDEEVRAYVAPIKETCASELGKDCQDHVKQFGVTIDEYFEEVALEEYRPILSIMKMKNDNLAPLLPRLDSSSTQEQYAKGDYVMSVFELGLRKNAQVEWFDPQIKAVYEQALKDPEVNVLEAIVSEGGPDTATR